MCFTYSEARHRRETIDALRRRRGSEEQDGRHVGAVTRPDPGSGLFEREIRDLTGRLDDPSAIAHTLVEMALQRGGPDNATVVVVIVDQP